MPVVSLPSSFRDPSGFLYESGGKLLRQVNDSYAEHYDALISSGLYAELSADGLLIPHVELDPIEDSDCYKILEPTRLPFISYPYEWSFSQLRDAALLTLEVQKRALAKGMILKDASAYNVQFHRGRPIFIDTLSFERYQQGEAWTAYRQFCEHFLAPLALVCHVDYRLAALLQTNIDGIPLDLASRLLPRKSWVKYSLLAHIHLHARSQQKYQGRAMGADESARARLSSARLDGLVASLKAAVAGLSWLPVETEWGGYYEDTNYSDTSMEHKAALVGQFLDRCDKSGELVAADFGANTGKFSRLVAQRGYFVVAYDVDPVSVEQHYLQVREDTELNVLPLVQDFTSPSPAIGWANQERMSFTERYSAEIGLALALIHHLHISNNVPLDRIATFFAAACRYLIVEFVPKSDSQVQRLLATREDIFPDYHEEGFSAAFGKVFTIVESRKIEGTERTLYFMERLAS